ncbi:sex peptide receptor-related protein 2-like [Argopecten irradians]|uniref:sex peptide receptor-related protein 2-like n=1 Tax=Argopecten irradians TaxID=31199 RepID=UPI0037219484
MAGPYNMSWSSAVTLTRTHGKFGMEQGTTSRQVNHILTEDDINKETFIVNFHKIFRYDFEIYIYGYVWPLLAVIVATVNSTLLYIFAKRHFMSRNVTHLLIGMLCLFDTLTLVIPSLAYVYVFVYMGIVSYLPYDLCSIWYFLTDMASTICHSTANLLTVTLAFQRCLSVTYPLQVGRWCTTQRTVIAAIICFAICVIPETINSLMFERKSVDVRLKDNKTISACSLEPLIDDVTIAYIPHIFVWLLLFKVIPCILLIVFGTIMIRQLRKATKVRSYLLHGKSSSAHHQRREAKLTVMIGWVIGILLVLEIPGSILVVLHVISMVFHVDIICREDLETILAVLYLIVISTFVSNFVIYYVNCEEFRTYFNHMITCSKKQRDTGTVHSKASNVSIISDTSEDGSMSALHMSTYRTLENVIDQRSPTQTVKNGDNASNKKVLFRQNTSENSQNGTTCGVPKNNSSLNQMTSYL